jgi:peptidyl-prolyl cis-trans isomerase SurA
MPSLKTLALLALVAAPVAAQEGGLRSIEVDRVVAVVARKPILMSEVLERLNMARARGMQVPRDSAGQLALARELLDQLVDEQVLVTVAEEFKLEVPETEVAPQVDRSITDIRGNFPSEAEFRAALAREGFGTPEEYRKRSIEQATRDALQKKALDTLRALGRLAPVNVTEREVSEAFERLKQQLGPRPEMVSFRQIVVAPRPREESRLAAMRRADSVRVALENGADFDSTARIMSQDPTSAVQGGDLGWSRRGKMVAEFDQAMFALIPGRISPLIETDYGFHIIRVDRVRAGEVRARHVLIKPVLDEADAERARQRADSARVQWSSGVPFDSVIARFHDRDEEKSIPEGVPLDSLPVEYRLALRGKADGAFTEVFALPDPSTGLRKYIVANVMSAKPAGQWSLEEFQERVRRQLREEKSMRRTLDILRREYYVSLRL